MQVEASAQATPGLIPSAGHPLHRMKNCPVFMRPAIDSTVLKCWRYALFFCVFAAGLLATEPTLVAQTGNVVISTNTTYATGTYNLTGLTVENGATLTVGGGSAVSVSGSVLVTANSNIVLQSINNGAQINGTWQGGGVTVNAGSVQVDAGSSINADGQGYLVSSGPGGAPAGSSAGGSYGGMGGSGPGVLAAAIYGSSTMPTDLGSGGGSRCCGAIAGNGGGLVRLIVSGTLTDNGVISANGGNLVGYQGGGGSGGSVWVTTAGLAGSGVFTANGGTGGEAAGGGGRIAVYYNAPSSSFTGFSTSTSNGGSCRTQCANGTASAGGTGTAAFFDTSASNPNLMVDQDLTIPANTTVTYNSIMVQAGAVLTIGGGSTITVTNALTVSGTVVAQSINNAAQINNAWQGSGVTLKAASVVVNTGGSINADNQGYVAGAGPGGSPNGSSAGGSYGGLGGVGDGVSPGPVYGSTTAPTDLGSGGNTRCCGTVPGFGGGALTITVSGTLTDNGVISADGGNGTGLQVGGGSGGTVSIQTGTLTGSGSIAVDGGLGGEAGGGGGRVAIYYNTNSGFDLTTVTSNGGASNGGNPGAVGTVYTLGSGSNLTVSNDTVLPPNANLSFSTVTVNNGATLTVGSGTSLAANSVTVTAASNLTVGGGSTLKISGAVLVTGNSQIVLQSTDNAAQVNGSWQGTGVTFNAGSVEVDQGSSINADAQGYLASAGPGGAQAGTSAGGSYGGLGGSGSGGLPAGPIYGSDLMPTDLGSGGGSRCCGAIAGVGGGLVRLIVSGKLTDNGVISANGGNLVGYQGGGGSGGSVWVMTAALAGSGVFTANGGTGGEAAGGGGRIAVYYNGPTSSFTGFSTTTANGGSCQTQCANGAASAGSTGTAAFFDISATNTNLMVDQDLTIPAGTTVSYNSITVQPNATLTIGGGSNITVAGALTVSGTLVAQTANNSAQVNGTWQGIGVTLHAASVLVNAGGSLNADGQGYLASAGPGGAPGGTSAGGSYGGIGGLGSGGIQALPIYGSDTMPTDPGSGGGSRCCGAIAGTGGGSIRLIVSGTLTDNGIISANGGNLVGYQGGGGSGGSLWVTTTSLAGSGVFAANGGTGGEAGAGGGRIAVYYYAPSSTFTGYSTSTATGGGCGTQCSNGTVSAGGNGTAGFFDTSATNSNLMVDQDLTVPAGTTVNYNSVTVEPGAVLTIGGGATINVAGSLTVSGMVVAQSINNTALINGTWQGTGVTINAASVIVNANGSITADGQGYVPSAGPGGAAPGTSSGGSYGGAGGAGDGFAALPTYGSATLPVDLGSGGGLRCCSTSAGSGGGALFFNVSGTLTNNGTISANGTAIVGYQAGGGSGGTVYVKTVGLSGSGAFTANGGLGGEAGGGGGRVALYYDGRSSNFTGFAASTASGAGCGTQCTDATASPGSNGTAGFFDTSATNNNLAIYQNFAVPARVSATYNTVTVQNGALLTIGGGSTLTVANALTVDGTVVGQSANNTVQVNGAWAGTGVSINAGTLTVNANGSLNADMQGYVANAGPGGSPANTSAGASYGGLGGVGNGSAPSPIYGSEMLPVDLGSGGGSRCCGTLPGVGGGELLLTIAGTLTDDGVISANASNATGLQVGGSAGGSINIHTTALTGTGSIAANGGSGGEAGGGGGRVAAYFTTATGFDLTKATATGGASSDGNAGAVGTVYFGGGPVTKVTSTTTVTALPAQVNAGQAVSFHAVVTAATGGPTPTGNVSFFDGTKLLGTQALSAAQQTGTATADFQTTALAVGTHSVTASYGGDANVLASSSAAQTVTIGQNATTSTLGLSAATITLGQTETLTATIAGGTGTPALTGTVNFFDATANASLGSIAVTSSATGGTAVLPVATLTVGTHVLNAHYSGDADYVASTTLNQTVVVTAKAQTITFAPIPNHVFGDAPFMLNATASSGLPVSYTVMSGPATVSGNVVTITGAGAVSIQASQAGNATMYAAATPVTQSFTVAKATQTIAFPPIPNHTAGDAPFQLNATASSGLAVSYSVTSGPATVAGNLVTVTGGGAVQIQATQAGNANYTAATAVNQSFTVSFESQTITFPAIPNHTLGDAPFALSASASSGLTVAYSVVSGSATVSANTVTLTGAGTVTVQAAQAGNAIYAAATPLTQTFTVSLPAPTLASITPVGGVVGSGATTITLTGANFAATDTVQLNGTAIATEFGSATSLTAVVPASFLATMGTGQITVFDSATRSTTAADSFTVFAAPAINFTGPSTTPPASQPTLTFQLVNPYPFPIAGSLSLAFAASASDGVDDPAVQFASGGRTLMYTIPALSQVTPTVQIQSGTVAGIATVTLVVTSNGVNVTPANVAPVQITIPPAVPMITTATLTRSGMTLTVVVDGFSNTRELSTATFHFTATPGSTLSTPDVTIPAATIFAEYYTSAVSAAYGSTFVYTQEFTLNDDASSIQNVVVTLVNSVGDSVQVTAQ